MSEPQHDPEPHTNQPRRRPPLRSGGGAGPAIVVGMVTLAITLFALSGPRREASAPASEPDPAPVARPAAEPVVQQAPAPMTAMERFRSCRPYDQYLADTRSGAVSEARLREEAACLCALAGGFTVRVDGNGLRQFREVAACPAGSAPMPLAPDAKQWKGEWIDEPGHGACVCSSHARELRAVVVKD